MTQQIDPAAEPTLSGEDAVAPFMPAFIIDTPATEDQIAAHGRIASAIAQVVRDGRVKIVGVLGEWGSGKSTVISLAQAQLKSTPAPIACFTFDAWQHQSDPQRRAFLEALVRFLEHADDYPISKDTISAWRLLLEKLNRQHEETKTSTQTKINFWSATFAVSLLLLPLGIRLIGDGTLSADDARDAAATALFWGGWGLVGFPLVLAALFLCFRKRFQGTTIYALLANKGPEDKIETKIRDPEPSAIEFQSAFRTIVSDARKVGPPLCIIVDNLDRLPPADAVSVWSTVRSIFLGNDGLRHPEDGGLPTIVMPLDETAIRGIYASKNDAEAVLAQSFIDKTFDVVFHVPKPVLSKRHAYLADRLRSVFGNAISEEEVHAVGSVFERHLSMGAPPSPRAINSFVNAVAVLAMQRTDRPISYPVIAYFVLNRSAIAPDVRGWVITRQEELAALGDDWQDGLAALHYGAPLDAAQELFIDEPLRDALQARDAQTVKRLSALPGFGRYFIRSLEGMQRGEYRIPVYGAAEILADLEAHDGWAGEAWNRLRSLAQQVVGSIGFEVQDQPGLAALIASCAPPQRTLFLESLAVALRETGSANVVLAGGGDGFAAAAKTMLDAADAVDLKDFVLPLPGGVPALAQMLIKDFSVEQTRRLAISNEDLVGLPAWLGAQLGTVDRFIVPTIASEMCGRGPDLDWSAILAPARAAMTNGDPESGAPAVRAIAALVAGSERARSHIQSWGRDGVLSNVFTLLWAHARNEAIPEAAALQMKLGDAMPISGESWEARLASNYDLVEQIDNSLAGMGVEVSAHWLEQRISDFPEDTPLLRLIFQRRFRRGDVTGSDVFDHPHLPARLFDGEGQSEVWKSAIGDVEALRDFLASVEIDQALPALEAFADFGDGRSRRKVLTDALRRPSADRWRRAINDGDGLYNLISRLTDGNKGITLGSTASQALMDTVPTMILAGADAYRDRWFDVADRLPANQLALLRTRIVNELLNHSGDAHRLRDILSRGGAPLQAVRQFTEDANRTVSQIIVPLAQDELGREWLLANAEIAGRWVRASHRPLRQGLGEQLKGYRDSGYANAEDLLRVFRL